MCLSKSYESLMIFKSSNPNDKYPPAFGTFFILIVFGDMFLIEGSMTYNNNNHLYSHKQLHVHGTYKALSTKLQLH